MPETIGVGETLRAAFAFWRTAVRAVPGVLTLYGVAIAWLSHVAPIQDAAAQVSGLLPFVLMTVLAEAALLRVYFGAGKPDDPDYRVGPLGFQFGKAELLVLASQLLCAPLLIFIAALLLLVLGAFLVSLGVVSGAVPKTPEELLALGPNLWLAVGVVVAGLFLWSWVGLRLSLASAASVAERRVLALSTFALTRGRFWLLLACQLLMRAPLLALSFIIDPLVAKQGVQVQAVLLLAMGLLASFWLTPLLTGVGAYVYTRVGPVPTKPGASA